MIETLMANRFLEEMRMLLLKEFLRLNQGFCQQELLKMVPLWNGYVGSLKFNFTDLYKAFMF